jgi:hypothetical protein
MVRLRANTGSAWSVTRSKAKRVHLAMSLSSSEIRLERSNLWVGLGSGFGAGVCRLGSGLRSADIVPRRTPLIAEIQITEPKQTSEARP